MSKVRVLSKPQADVDDGRTRSVRKATPVVEGQGVALERQESPEPRRMRQELSSPHVVRQESLVPHEVGNPEELLVRPDVSMWKLR
jgi:hypothetical protein